MRNTTTVPTAAEFGFPSPAADDINLSTPSLERASHAAVISPGQWPIDDSTVVSSGALPLAPEPDVVKHEDVVTPGQEIMSQLPLSFDAIVGADVDPAPSDALSLPSSSKAGPALRLPSFASLGIAAVHSNPELHLSHDRIERGELLPMLPQSSVPNVGATSDDFLSDSAPLEQIEVFRQSVQSPAVRTIASPLPSPLHHFVTTLTPPDENGRITWEAIAKAATGSMDSPTTEPNIAAADIEATEDSATDSVVAAESNSEPATYSVPAISVSDDIATSASVIADLSIADTPSWVDPVINAMLNNINMSERTGPIKILSHALPTPAVEGHIFPAVIRSLQDQTPTSPMCWINVFHALPGKFNLADLPRSPPSTPGPAIGGDDYFTSKTFDTAVRVCDYNDSLHTLPQSPSPIVPPASVDVSIVERYIPPSSVNEFSEMFNVKGPSILIDRLVELSPDNGTLIFVYPTKKGARTFTNEYLGPILEPLLRTIVVVNGFSADMGSSAGKMAAAAALPDHDVMLMRIQSLCATLSQTSPRMEKFHRKQAKFSVVYAAKEEVKLEREVWADMWWCKQEKPRLRETINRYFRKANRALEDKTPPMIIQELLDGVARNPYRYGEPTSAIEVSAFVITRSG
ncbi:hypothetical protein AAFC00_004334 [Neodothiora populina]|uniref:Uncharacterized protein n=1 Tax=Neodothiora populina TaxID=2781224 RepID=A0ABR3PJR4_9PEZI